MEIKGTVHCLFEQSGTFKNEFRKLGYMAYDYDIENEFGQTDFVCDIFSHIERAYNAKKSLFDVFNEEDLILAFFPCVYFCENNRLYFNATHRNLKKLSQSDIIKIILMRAQDREKFYEIALKLFYVCHEKQLRLIVENPYSTQHYLVNNFPYHATLIDRNRTLRGDNFVKPTQYWFINCEPTCGESLQVNKKCIKVNQCKKGKKSGMCSKERSLISTDYARNFICDFILGKKQTYTQLDLFNI